MKQTKLCVACKGYVPIDQFERAEFPTRDGYRHCCRNHVMPRYKRLENGRLEEVKDDSERK